MLTYDKLREFVKVIGTVGGTDIDAVVGPNKIMALCRAVEREARREALEEAARVCENQEWDWDDKAFNCGAKIRALIDQPGR